jgi:excisionase family DNA binding protein
MQIILNKLNEILELVRGTNPSRYMDINEVAEVCNISKSTIRRNVQKGSLKCSQKLGKMLFKVQEIERWLNG